MRTPAVLLVLILPMLLTGCEREARRFKQPASSAVPAQAMQSAELQAGGIPNTQTASNLYEENAYAMSQGKRLFTWFNCVGCHANGGGGSGPALMDDKWLYGHQPANIYASIVEGRPNGMPSFRGKIAEDQVWQLVAYVRSMSGLATSVAAPSRNDDIQTTGGETSRDPAQPKTSAVPQSR